MTSREFTESLAFERLEPDPARETVRLLGLLVTMYANTHRDRDSKPVPYSFDDFVPNPYGPSRAEREAAFAKTMAEFSAHAKTRKAERSN